MPALKALHSVTGPFSTKQYSRGMLNSTASTQPTLDSMATFLAGGVIASQTFRFAGTRFDGEANFTGRSFERTANFSNARFYYPPDFDAATNHARIDFTGAHVGLLLLANGFIGPRTAVSQSACALFEKSRRRQKTMISNATFISRNAMPSAASICVNGGKS